MNLQRAYSVKLSSLHVQRKITNGKHKLFLVVCTLDVPV